MQSSNGISFNLYQKAYISDTGCLYSWVADHGEKTEPERQEKLDPDPTIEQQITKSPIPFLFQYKFRPESSRWDRPTAW